MAKKPLKRKKKKKRTPPKNIRGTSTRKIQESNWSEEAYQAKLDDIKHEIIEFNKKYKNDPRFKDKWFLKWS